MNIKKLFLLGVFPILLMVYGWYLGQQHQSMMDLAGILMFITGAGGWLISLLLRFSIRRIKWFDTWWSNLLTGLAGCAMVFLVILIYARING
jgi:hypothetical protein